MKPFVAKIKPANGFAYLAHLGLLILLPVVVYILVRLQFTQLALSMVLLSKWRMFAVRPRFWPAIIRANLVDIIVGVSLLIFMINSPTIMLQLMWAVLYGGWLVIIKPATSTLMVSLQAMIAQFTGLMALFLIWSDRPLYGLVLATGCVCYLSARHFFDSFDEPYSRLLSYIWGYFGAALTWVLGHWLFFYGIVAQPTLILTTLGYGLAVLYYFDHAGRLTTPLRRQLMFVITAIIVVALVRTNWGNDI